MKVHRVGGYMDTRPGDDGRRTRWVTYDVGRQRVRVNVSPKIGTHYCVACNSETCRHAAAVRRSLAARC